MIEFRNETVYCGKLYHTVAVPILLVACSRAVTNVAGVSCCALPSARPTLPSARCRSPEVYDQLPKPGTTATELACIPGPVLPTTVPLPEPLNIDVRAV